MAQYYDVYAKDILGIPELTRAQTEEMDRRTHHDDAVFMHDNSDIIPLLFPNITVGDIVHLKDRGDYRNDGIHFWDGSKVVPINDIPESDYGTPPFFVGDHFSVGHFRDTYCKKVTINIAKYRDELLSNLTPFHTSFNGVMIYIITSSPYKSYCELLRILKEEDEYRFNVDYVEDSLVYIDNADDMTDIRADLEKIGCTSVNYNGLTYTYYYKSQSYTCIKEYDIVFDIGIYGTLDY